MKTIVLYNPCSRTVPPDAKERLCSALESVGVHGADLVETEKGGGGAQLKQLAAAKPDLFVVWGGDGTLRSALSTVGQDNPNLLLLPGGTMNLLTNAIHGQKPWETILRDVLAAPKRHTLEGGKVNGELFYCAMLAGTPAKLAEARESFRRGELVKAAAETAAALDTIGKFHLDARYGDGYSFGDGRLPTTSIIGAMVGPLTKAGKGMEVGALAEPTTGGALNVIWTSFTSDWRNAPGVTMAEARSLVVESGDDGDIPVIVDGEPIEVGRKLRVDFVEEASQCLTAG